jgi:hypothetical protein
MQNIAPRSQLPAISGLTNASVWRVAATFATGRAQATEQLAELNRRYEACMANVDPGDRDALKEWFAGCIEADPNFCER